MRRAEGDSVDASPGRAGVDRGKRIPDVCGKTRVMSEEIVQESGDESAVPRPEVPAGTGEMVNDGVGGLPRGGDELEQLGGMPVEG